jgi:hypothetical protein
MFSILIFVFVLFISQIKQLWSILWIILKPVFNIIYKVIYYITSFTSASDDFSGKGKNMNPQNMVLNQPNIFVEIIFTLLALAIIIIMILITVYLCINYISKFIKWLSGVLSINETGDNTLGYTDEKESLLKSVTKHPNRFKMKLFFRSRKELCWKDMKTNSEKVRYIYKQTVLRFMKMGYVFRSCLTPLEVSRELDESYIKSTDNCNITGLAALYNKARYGKDTITDLEVETLLSKTNQAVKNHRN